MPSQREWLYSTLAGSTPLAGHVGNRIYQSTSFEEVPGTKPFITYRLGTSFTTMPGDDRLKIVSQPMQIFVHDVPGDFARIDEIFELLRTLLVNHFDHPVVMRCDWIEESEDLRDDEMMTITRYARYQLAVRQG